MLKEKWSKGKHYGTVVSDTRTKTTIPDGRSHNDVDYYGGYLIAESIPKQEYINVISRSLAMLTLLEKALPLIEREAEQREQEIADIGDPSWPNTMRDLANKISTEINRARGKDIPEPDVCPHGFGFIEHCPDCKEALHG